MGAQGGSALLSLLAAWWVTRCLGARDYGVVVAVLTLSQTVSQLMLQWSSTALVRFGTEEFVRTGRLEQAFWVRTWLLALCLGAAAATSPAWHPLLAGWLRLPEGLTGIVLAHLGATAVWTHAQLALQAVKLPRRQAALQVLERLGVFTGLLVLASVSPPKPWIWVWPYVVSPLIAAAAALILLASYVGRPRLVGVTVLRPMLRFSLPLIPYFAVGYFSTSLLDAFFLLRTHTHQELASYSISYQAAGSLMQLPALAGSLQLPLLITLEAAGRGAGVQRLFGQVLPIACLAWTVACVSLAALGSTLFPLLLGPSLRDTGALLWPLLAAAAIAGPVMLGYGPLTNARGSTHAAMRAGVVSSGVNVGLNYLLIPRLGLAGCAWATVAAYAVSLLILEDSARRLVGAPVSRLAWTSLPAVVAALVAGSGLGAWVSWGMGVGASLAVAASMRAMLVPGFILMRTTGRQWLTDRRSSTRS